MAMRRPPETLTIAAAAQLLGVSEPTLRRWDRLGKFCARRHPMSGFRLYSRAEVMRLRAQILGRVA
jgi:DNA-binding transcriptional MerR regulator